MKETEAIFEQLSQVHAQAQADPGVLRLSMDSKAAVKVGPFSRHGQTRLPLEAADHDFKPQEVLSPFGIFLPQQNETYLYFTTSSVTAGHGIARRKEQDRRRRITLPKTPQQAQAVLSWKPPV